MYQNRTFAWLAYFALIGWVVSIAMYSYSERGNSLVRFHLRQALGVNLLGVAAGLFWIVPFFAKLIILAAIVFWILGIISAVQGEEKPVPFLGKYFQVWFDFIR